MKYIDIEQLSPKGNSVVTVLILLLDYQEQKNIEQIPGLQKIRMVEELEETLVDKFQQLDRDTQRAIHSILTDHSARDWDNWMTNHCEKYPSDAIVLNKIRREALALLCAINTKAAQRIESEGVLWVNRKPVFLDDGIPSNLPHWYLELSR